ncbi:MAG: EhaF family protein [Methanomicrobiales archaeon]|nr:EhaF family protein [Methanomicrobiales archaeon]
MKPEGQGSLISRISRELSNYDYLAAVYALLVIVVTIVGVLTLPFLSYEDGQIYGKHIDRQSPLDPYDRGGTPFNATIVHAQYPENSPTLGYVTAYLTPLSQFFADTTQHLGTTIVAHPGGIIDEILYNTRGLDTVVESSILFVAFAIAAYLFRRGAV